MENVTTFHCSFANWCLKCASLSIPYVVNITRVAERCSVKQNIRPKNVQTKNEIYYFGTDLTCCDGYVDVFYIPVSESTMTVLTTYSEIPTTDQTTTITPSPVTESTPARSTMTTRVHTAIFHLTPSAMMLTILGSVALFFVLLALTCLLVRCKRKSKKIANDKMLYINTTSSDGAAEYSTIEETKELMNALTTSKTISKGIHPCDNYFVLEKTYVHNKIHHFQIADVDVMDNPESNIYNTVERVESNSYKRDYTGESDIYNTLNEHRKQVQIDEDSCYSHFSDFNDKIYSHTIRPK